MKKLFLPKSSVKNDLYTKLDEDFDLGDKLNIELKEFNYYKNSPDYIRIPNSKEDKVIGKIISQTIIDYKL